MLAIVCSNNSQLGLLTDDKVLGLCMESSL